MKDLCLRNKTKKTNITKHKYNILINEYIKQHSIKADKLKLKDELGRTIELMPFSLWKRHVMIF